MRREVADAVRRAVEKVLHAPTVRVKELASTPGGDQYAAALRELFDLDPAAVESVAAVKKTREQPMTPRPPRHACASAPARSALARTQTGQVVSALDAPDRDRPDRHRGRPVSAALAQIGGTGVFVSALRNALLAREIDVAVHSYKDLPTAPAEGIVIAAVPRREDPRDALVARDGLTLGELPAGARVGTGSPRRAAQLRALGLGLEVVELRGNVDTRLGKVARGELDAVVLAYAGLRRLGRDGDVTEVLDPIQLLPAPAQGALAVECRASDDGALGLLAELDARRHRSGRDRRTGAARSARGGLFGPRGCPGRSGCAELVDEVMTVEVFLRGSVTAVDGSDAVRLSVTGATTDADGVGRRLAADLLANGADTNDGELEMTRARKVIGRVTFVGAGPGDPGLLAVHAVEALRRADLVVVDAKVPASITALATAEVRRAEATPADTAKLMLAEARAGLSVVRLIAGDPLADDSAVKEALAVAKTVVPFEVVPGVPVGVGTAAYAGVPFGSVRTEADVVTATSDFEALAHAPGTLVLTVAATDVAIVGEQLVANGLKPDTAGHGQLRRHQHRPADGARHAGRTRTGRGRDERHRSSSSSARPQRSATSSLGGSPARCTAGRCSSRGRRIRPAR